MRRIAASLSPLLIVSTSVDTLITTTSGNFSRSTRNCQSRARCVGSFYQKMNESLSHFAWGRGKGRGKRGRRRSMRGGGGRRINETRLKCFLTAEIYLDFDVAGLIIIAKVNLH